MPASNTPATDPARTGRGDGAAAQRVAPPAATRAPPRAVRRRPRWLRLGAWPDAADAAFAWGALAAAVAVFADFAARQ
jgi:hypothetical protein